MNAEGDRRPSNVASDSRVSVDGSDGNARGRAAAMPAGAAATVRGPPAPPSPRRTARSARTAARRAAARTLFTRPRMPPLRNRPTCAWPARRPSHAP